jgi:hypothetical protein
LLRRCRIACSRRCKATRQQRHDTGPQASVAPLFWGPCMLCPPCAYSSDACCKHVVHIHMTTSLKQIGQQLSSSSWLPSQKAAQAKDRNEAEHMAAAADTQAR